MTAARLIGRPEEGAGFVTVAKLEVRVRYDVTEGRCRFRCDACGTQLDPICPHATAVAAQLATRGTTQ